MTVQDDLKPLPSLSEPLQVALDNGAKKALIPIENKRHFFDVSAEIAEAGGRYESSGNYLITISPSPLLPKTSGVYISSTLVEGREYVPGVVTRTK